MHNLSPSLSFRLFRYLLTIGIIAALLIAISPVAQAEPPRPEKRVHPLLWRLAQEQPNTPVRVIIKKDRPERAAQAILGQEGAVKRELPMVGSFVTELPARAVQSLANAPGVAWITLDAPMAAMSAPINVSNLSNVYIRSIGADRLWNTAPYLQGQGITVAVVDSGITPWADIKQNSSGTQRILGWTEKSATPSNIPDDINGHGTHVAGIIGGNGQMSQGKYIGVAPGVNLINVKVTDNEGRSYVSDVIDGLQWVLANKNTYNIRVVNLSLNSTVAESYQTSPLSAAVELLWFNGIVVVVAAGNNGSSSGPVPIYPPANDPFVITVGAVDDKGTLDLNDDVWATFSAFGQTIDGYAKPDLVAPGRNIVSLIGKVDGRLPTSHPAHVVKETNSLEPHYFRMSGTSMATPVVSGAVALLLQDEPNLTPDQVKFRLISTARSLAVPHPGAAGAGHLDIFAAVQGTSTNSANLNIPVSQMIDVGSSGTAWNSVNWNSVNWNSVNWNSVNWNSVNWNSVNWTSITTNAYLWDD